MVVLHCGNRDFRTLLLPWPWPWPDDLRVRPYPHLLNMYPQTTNGLSMSRLSKLIILGLHTYNVIHTDRQIDRETDILKLLPRCFTAGNNQCYCRKNGGLSMMHVVHLLQLQGPYDGDPGKLEEWNKVNQGCLLSPRSSRPSVGPSQWTSQVSSAASFELHFEAIRFRFDFDLFNRVTHC